MSAIDSLIGQDRQHHAHGQTKPRKALDAVWDDVRL